MDVTVASTALQPGDVALRIPEHLIVTLDRVLEDNTLAELVTTGKLSGGWRGGGRLGGLLPRCVLRAVCACACAAAAAAAPNAPL